MPEISCTAKKCTFNKEGLCAKDNIKIDVTDHCDAESCTCCDTFQQGCSDTCGCGCKNHCGEDVTVECLANECIYNAAGECTATHINVEGNNAGCCTDTFCDTFRT